MRQADRDGTWRTGLGDGLLVVGTLLISSIADSVKSHEGFASKHHLPFPLLSDPDKSTITDGESLAG